jgi:hypothetical protein
MSLRAEHLVFRISAANLQFRHTGRSAAGLTPYSHPHYGFTMGIQYRARVLFGVTALVAFVAVIMQSVNAGRTQSGPFYTAPGRVLNLFCYFTIDSNILIAVVSVALMIAPHHNSILLQVGRLAGLISILITGLVFQLALAGQHLAGIRLWPAVANVLLHAVEPILYPLGWLMFGPRGWITSRVIGLALLPPLAWLGFTLIRGPFIHWYPYPFLDVNHIGYWRTFVACGIVAAVFLALTAAAASLDRRFLAARRSARPVHLAHAAALVPAHP